MGKARKVSRKTFEWFVGRLLVKRSVCAMLLGAVGGIVVAVVDIANEHYECVCASVCESCCC